MKILSMAQIEKRREVVEGLRSAVESVNEAIEEFNEAAEKAFGAVASSVSEYNEALRAAVDFVEEVTSDAKCYFDERSEAWQEGEVGRQYQDWISEWENLNLEEMEVDQPDNLDEVTDDLAQEIEDIAESPDEM